MRIAHVVPVYPPARGGTGHVAHEYTERLRGRGHSVEVFTPRYHHVERDPPYVHRVRALLRAGNAAFVPSLFRRLRSFPLVHLHYPFFGGAEPTALCRALARDQTLVLSYYMDAVAPGLKGRLFDLHRRVLLPWMLARADAVLVSSTDYAEHSALALVHGALERVEVHPFGVDLERFHPGEERDLRMSLGIAPEEPVVLFVGALDPAHHFKGFPVLVEALQGLTDVRWRLVVVGEGLLRARFETLAASRGLAGRVHFAGDVADEVLPRYYRLADIHVLPSTERAEAFGLVVLEAAASGVPTIASSLPGVRTIVLDGETGLHVPPGDPAGLQAALRVLLDQSDLRRRLGQGARARAVARSSWEPLIDRLDETYRSSAAARGRGLNERT